MLCSLPQPDIKLLSGEPFGGSSSWERVGGISETTFPCSTHIEAAVTDLALRNKAGVRL